MLILDLLIVYLILRDEQDTVGCRLQRRQEDVIRERQRNNAFEDFRGAKKSATVVAFLIC